MSRMASDQIPDTTAPHISARHRVTLAVAAAFLALVLLSRLGVSPRRWRSIEPLMTTQQLALKLGPPVAHSTNLMRWREPRLLGHWELIVACEDHHAARIERKFFWAGSTPARDTSIRGGGQP
jgi:hypothetical protein